MRRSAHLNWVSLYNGSKNWEKDEPLTTGPRPDIGWVIPAVSSFAQGFQWNDLELTRPDKLGYLIAKTGWRLSWRPKALS